MGHQIPQKKKEREESEQRERTPGSVCSLAHPSAEPVEETMEGGQMESLLLIELTLWDVAYL